MKIKSGKRFRARSVPEQNVTFPVTGSKLYSNCHYVGLEYFFFM
jgi:hypothetical protein